jgi:tellurite resistance protein TerC
MTTLLPWIGFIVFVLAMLAIDLGIFHRESHEVKMKEAIGWSAIWITLAFAFNAIIWTTMGAPKGMEFLTAYIIEKSLSVDNIFIIVLLFSAFQVDKKYQHRVLFWGIIGALIMRGLFIAGGVSLITYFHPIIYIFGAFLVFTGLKMLFTHGKEVDFEKNIVLRLARKYFRVTPGYVGDKFIVVQNGQRFITPLFLVLLLVEATDLIFAVDSIPAVLAISHDPFIVFTSNVFAILGLRSLYFALAGAVQSFRYLTHALATILMFVGTKMMIADFYKVPTNISLVVIVTVLTIGGLASWMYNHRQKKVK